MFLKVLFKIIIVISVTFAYASDKNDDVLSDSAGKGAASSMVEKEVIFRNITVKKQDEQDFIKKMFADEQFKKYFIYCKTSDKDKEIKKALEKCLKGHKSYLMIVDADRKERVGVISINHYINRFYVTVAIEKELREKGYGTAAMKKSIEYVRKVKSRNDVWVLSKNPAMIRILKRLDFSETEGVSDYDHVPSPRHFTFQGLRTSRENSTPPATKELQQND